MNHADCYPRSVSTHDHIQRNPALSKSVFSSIIFGVLSTTTWWFSTSTMTSFIARKSFIRCLESFIFPVVRISHLQREVMAMRDPLRSASRPSRLELWIAPFANMLSHMNSIEAPAMSMLSLSMLG